MNQVPAALDPSAAFQTGGPPGAPGLGVALPERVVTSAEVAERLGVDEHWVVSRTGIRERRWLRDDERLADLAVAAAEQALQGSGPHIPHVDLVIVATCSPEDQIPGLGPEVAARVGAAAGFDVNAACTGFLVALSLASAHVESGRAESVLVIGAERLSSLLDPAERGTAALFGDGAGALLVTESRLGPVTLRSDHHRNHLFARDGRLRMAGTEVFKHAVNRMAEAAEGVDADRYVFHQANARITAAVGRRLGLDSDRVVDCIETVGNLSAASLPVALAHADPQPGERLLLCAFGAGFTWGSAVLTW